MEDRQAIILIGGGGHCRAVIDVLEMSEDFVIAGILDKLEKVGQKVLGYDIIAADEHILQVAEDFHHFLVTVGQIQNSANRERIYQEVKSAGGSLSVVVSSLAHVSDYAHLGEGTVVMHHALVNAGATVGCNSIINSKALVEHDAQIGDHCHIATGALVNGGCQVGSCTFIGSHAVLVQEVTIGEHIVVGAGSVVTENLLEPGVYAGVPARFIREL